MSRILTGVKPTGMPHIGNYIGAIRPALEMAANPDHESFLFIADYHALTTMHKAEELKQGTYEVAATWLALGLDPDRTVIFRQSEIPEILELSYILACFTAKGLMNRAHAYKAIVQANEEAGKKDLDANVSMGLYTYPILMSSDILSFDSDLVPVGEDQLQHMEICRDIASRMNNVYKSEALKLPEPIVQKVKLLPGLDGRKMSKSYNNSIPLFCPEKKLRKLVMKVKTDSQPPESPKDPDDSLVFDYFRLFAGPERQEQEKTTYRQGISWGEAKQNLFEQINEELTQPRETYNELMADTRKIDEVLEAGRDKARKVAGQVLNRVKSTVGLSFSN